MYLVDRNSSSTKPESFIVDPSKNRRIDVTRYMSAELDLSTQLFGGAKNLET
ncbi:MAG: hypothetical protein HC767_08985, partial [Akkermansiaceae bacterium]|nr:hypothetical protein [Akkermansiaceae bacterium]